MNLPQYISLLIILPNKLMGEQGVICDKYPSECIFFSTC